MLINRNTSLPSVPGTGYRNAASTFEALQNALQFYLKLKDQQDRDAFRDKELALKQKNEERQQGGNDAQAQYYRALAANQTDTNRRLEEAAQNKDFETNADLYSGQRLPANDPYVERITKAGKAGLMLSPEQTLPAQRLPGAMMGMPAGAPSPQPQPQMPSGGPPQYFQPVPSERTGQMIMNETNPAKLRIAQEAVAARKAHDEQIAATAAAGQANTAAIADRGIKSQQLIAAARNAVQQAGIYTRDATQNRAIDAAIATAIANMTDKDVDNNLKQDAVNPTAFLKHLQDTGVLPSVLGAFQGAIGGAKRSAPSSGAPNLSDPFGIR